jgi:hypothetical protein
MTKGSENLITWGLLAFIAYELYQSAAPAPSRPSNPILTNIPIWVQQLSAAEQRDYIDTTSKGMANQIFDNLLSIPQGPGGGSYIGPYTPAAGIDFFNPTTGIFSMCR